jgi:hypothetical protein
MMKDKARRGILVVLGAVFVSWLFVLAASYTDLFVNPVFDDGVYVGQDPPVQASTYLLFGAVAIVAAAVIVSQRLAIAARLDQGPDARLPRAVHRFTTLTIVVTLGVATVFGFVVFTSSFPGGGEEQELSLRLWTTYVPIILYTAVIVTVLLVGFVFRKDSLPKTVTSPVATARSESVDESADNRALGAAYAIPIIAGAIALIFGLIVYDVTGTSLDTWIWVIIHVILAVGIVVGAIFAERAIKGDVDPTSSRTRITRSSRILNFVLSIVFIAVTLGMGYGMGSGAVGGLRIAPQLWVEVFPGASENVEDVIVAVNAYDLSPGTPVTVTIEPSATVLISSEVERFREFFGQENLPGDLVAGDYTVEAVATGFGGDEITRSVRFSVTDDGLVELKSLMGGGWVEPEGTVIAPTWSWGLRDMLPTLVIFLIGLATTFITLTRRNVQPTASP